jgi:nicotinamidase-related amidase
VTKVELRLRRRRLVQTDPVLARSWTTTEDVRTVATSTVAVVICDMWDRHWSAGATLRVGALAPKVDAFCTRMREAGCLIVHAPSGTMDAYASHPARQRALECSEAGQLVTTAPTEATSLPPLPIDDTGGGSDTEDPFPVGHKAWARQHEAIHIHDDLDIITDEGGLLASYLKSEDRDQVLMTGVHTNMCVLHRSFGLIALGSMGFACVLVADLTDAMYDPARSPYVNHDEGTQLVVKYIESFVAPTTLSNEVVVLSSISVT